MLYIMLLNLQLVLFFVCLIVESLKKVLMCYLTMGNTMVYRTTIILNTMNKVVDCMEFKVVEGWST